MTEEVAAVDPGVALSGPSNYDPVQDMGFLDDPETPQVPSETSVVEAAPESPEGEGVKEAPAAPKSSVPFDVFKPKVAEPASKPEEPQVKPEDPLASYDPRKDPEAPIEVRRGDQKATNAWMKGKRHEKELESKLAEALKKLESQEAAPKEKAPDVEEFATLKRQLEEAEAKIGRLDLSQSRAFKAQFDSRIESEFNKGVAMLVRSGVPKEEAVSKMRDLARPGVSYDEIQEKLSEQPIALQGALYSLVTDLSAIHEQRQMALDDWRKTAPALKENENRISVAELSKAVVADTDAAVEQLRNEGSWMYKFSDGDEVWNSEVRKRVGMVHGILKASNPKEIVRYVADGIVAREYRKLFEASAEEVDRLCSELNARVRVTPGVGANGVRRGTAAPSKTGAISVDRWLDENITPD